MAPPPVDTAMAQSHVDPIVSLPAPLIRLLVLFAGPIHYARSLLEILLWKAGRRVESWMVLIAWWIFCLGGPYVFRWLLPPLIFLPLLPLSQLRLSPKKSPPKNGPENTATHDQLLGTLSNLHAIHALLPATPATPFAAIYARFRLLGARRLVRALVILWSTWIVLGHVIGYQSLFALLGTILILIPSPALAHVVHLLSRSLFVRRGAALVFLLIFGSPPDQAYPFSLHFSLAGWVKSKWAASRRPSLAFSFRPTVAKQAGAVSDSAVEDDGEGGAPASEPIFFRFEVHENQRWWMGLDWTSALLPQERPSWCDYHLQPVSPPASFALPASNSIILPNPTKADPNARVKRIATWQWLDDDWSIVRAGQNVPATNVSPNAPAPIPEEQEALSSGYSINGTQRPNSQLLATSPSSNSFDEHMQPPGPQTPGARTQSIAEQAFTKGLERLKARTSSPVTAVRSQTTAVPPPQRTSGEFQRGRKGSQASEDGGKDGDQGPVPLETIAPRDESTDADGWVYGDNKWENMSARGGLGKYTRRRRWQRRAVLEEVVIPLPGNAGEGDSKAKPSAAIRTSQTSPLKSRASIAPQPVLAETRSIDGESDDGKTSIRLSSGSASFKSPTSFTSATGQSRDDVLRQRLKKAMGNAGA